jgi:hypothetical protein
MIAVGQVPYPGYEPSPLGRRVARVFQGEAFFFAQQNRTKPLGEGSGVLGLLAGSPVANVQVVRSLQDLGRVAPVFLANRFHTAFAATMAPDPPKMAARQAR